MPQQPESTSLTSYPAHLARPRWVPCHHRLLVAMAVEERGRVPPLKEASDPRALAQKELLEEEARPGHLPRLLGAHQLHPFIRAG